MRVAWRTSRPVVPLPRLRLRCDPRSACADLACTAVQVCHQAGRATCRPTWTWRTGAIPPQAPTALSRAPLDHTAPRPARTGRSPHRPTLPMPQVSWQAMHCPTAGPCAPSGQLLHVLPVAVTPVTDAVQGMDCAQDSRTALWLLSAASTAHMGLGWSDIGPPVPYWYRLNCIMHCV